MSVDKLVDTVDNPGDNLWITLWIPLRVAPPRVSRPLSVAVGVEHTSEVTAILCNRPPQKLGNTHIRPAQ